MKQTELLKNLAKLTPYQKRKLEMYVIDALKLNAEDQDNRPKYCPYCKKDSRMIKKGFKHGKQRYQCKDCEHVFTYNSHTITMYWSKRMIVHLYNSNHIQHTTR
ncbi:IS1/IS1595 family N-terminal zinc-binding domain-containing protein [Amedibacillus sp. YH-ame6]